MSDAENFKAWENTVKSIDNHIGIYYSDREHRATIIAEWLDEIRNPVYHLLDTKLMVKNILIPDAEVVKFYKEIENE